ncbi:hypothetical protein Dsin_006182 [Dipteronia sinensis]|uniref:Uncharacterized protein n=1 Tax=Dipteronia sinensis TaxID=43782 RepID=A0AAE0AZ41_9ROSI|nr:hypothetical protein Dsin_006182 [Dipteronia sinensis]
MNFIENISFVGEIKSNPEEVKKGVANYFEKQYKNVPWCRPKVNGLPLKKLSETERDSLEELFSPDVVWTTLSSCDGNKVPGLDGFNLNFIKKNWNVIMVDFMKFLEDFHQNGDSVKDLNRTFIALIPKCVKPDFMKDFRLICL